jgi:hypothetical protein
LPRLTLWLLLFLRGFCRRKKKKRKYKTSIDHDVLMQLVRILCQKCRAYVNVHNLGPYSLTTNGVIPQQSYRFDCIE